MSTYMYGVLRWPAPRRLHVTDELGVGTPPAAVELLLHRSLAAMVSRVSSDFDSQSQSPRALRRDMRAHAALLNRLLAETTILPLRFGVVFPDNRSVISDLLQPFSARLNELLDQLEGAVELTLRATYIEQQVLQEVVAEHRELGPSRSAARRGARSYQGRVELGQRVAQAIHQSQDRDARWLLSVIRPLVRAVNFGKPLNDLMVLNASVLVDRSDLPKFDRLLEKLQAAEGHRMQLDCVGPLPPYSFAKL